MQTMVNALKSKATGALRGSAGVAAARYGRVELNWRVQAGALEEMSFLPILAVMKTRPEVYTTSPTASAFSAVVDMIKHRSGSLMVMENNVMAGIVTERDVLDKLGQVI